MTPPNADDVVIVGAGAAGLAVAAFLGDLRCPGSIALLDGARVPGAKILVSGGGRCNVTNVVVSERDFWGGSQTFIRQVLRGLSVRDTIGFFARIGVPLHEEEHGKLFPDSQRARDVLEALLHQAGRAGARLRPGYRVTDIERTGDCFTLSTSHGPVRARRVVLATGGQALPKSGSDGRGYAIARELGHTIVPTTPALVPLLLDDAPGALHKRLTGVAHDAEIAIWVDGRVSNRFVGGLLWTHFGVSGPVVLDVSRHWARAQMERRSVVLTLNVCPGASLQDIDARLLGLTTERPRASLQTLLAGMLPGSVANAFLESAGLSPGQRAGQLTREDRRRMALTLVEKPLPVVGTRGYTHAEATAGGVSLDDVDPGTLESRICPGLYLVGEVLDVDGRLGGFNFQWAWSSARVAARAIAAAAGVPSR